MALSESKVFSNLEQHLESIQSNLKCDDNDESFDGETHARIVGCQAQMTSFEFFYGLNLAYRLYTMTNNLSKRIHKEPFFVVDDQRRANLMLQALKGTRKDVDEILFYNTIVKKATNHEFIECSVLPRDRKRPDCKSIEKHFSINGYKQGSKAHHPTVLKHYYGSIYFEALDIISVSIKTRFDQQSFKAFLNLESVFLQSSNNGIIYDDLVPFINKT